MSSISSDTLQLANLIQGLSLADRTEISLAKCAVSDSNLNERQAMFRWQEWQTGTVDLAPVLESLALSQSDFKMLLAEKEQSLQNRVGTTPKWICDFTAIFQQVNVPADFKVFPASFERYTMSGFLNSIAPLLHHTLHQTVTASEQCVSSGPVAKDAVLKLFYSALLQQALWMISRPMTLELNIARVEDLLSGDTPEARFADFIRNISDPQIALALLSDYPVLVRQLMQLMRQWQTNTVNFLNRLSQDWEQICTTFGISPTSELVDIQGGAGDSHDGGQAVMILYFSDGSRLAYKPRSLAVDQHFQDFIRWVNAKSECLDLKILRVLDQVNYGWMEFAEYKPCESEAEIKDFYLRFGGVIAVLHLLKATDFHYENLIAHGAYPVPIDLESLFQPRVYGIDAEDTPQLVQQQLMNSVLRIGLLPTQDSSNLDISGIGAAAGQVATNKALSWTQGGTDALHVIREEIQMQEGEHKPAVKGGVINPADYAAEIITGFTQIYRVFLRARNELLASKSVINAFRNDEVRVLLRHTRFYGQLLRESYHPDVLQHGIDRDYLFENLWAHTDALPKLATVVRAESDMLWKGDIPKFVTQTGSLQLKAANGEIYNNYIDNSGLELVHQTVENLSEHDLAQQLWIIHSSLAHLDKSIAKHPVHRAPYPSFRIKADTTELLLDHASEIASYVRKSAIETPEGVSWIGLNPESGIIPVQADLYDGLAGLALFYGYLGELTSTKENTLFARKILNTLTESRSLQPTIIGAYSGLAGLVYTLTHLGVLWSDAQLIKQALAHARQLDQLLVDDKVLDVIGGAAGAIPCLLGLYRVTKDASVLAIAVRCGDHLLANAVETGGIAYWLTVDDTTPLVGLSHGATGIVKALQQLAIMSGEQRFTRLAAKGLAFEASQFDEVADNWPDLRSHDDGGHSSKKTFSPIWCHGAPGIGLARLVSYQQDPSESVLQQLRRAAQIVITTDIQSHSMCHGSLGNLDLLLELQKLPEFADLQPAMRGKLTEVLQSAAETGWYCGNQADVETVGLMTGLSGIGYQLLRMVNPERVPSVLALSSPSIFE